MAGITLNLYLLHQAKGPIVIIQPRTFPSKTSRGSRISTIGYDLKESLRLSTNTITSYPLTIDKRQRLITLLHQQACHLEVSRCLNTALALPLNRQTIRKTPPNIIGMPFQYTLAHSEFY